MEWFDNDERQMEEFVQSNNWLLPSPPEHQVAPTPGTGSATAPVDLSDNASAEWGDFNEMEPVGQRPGKATASGAGDDGGGGPKKYSAKETLILARCFIDVSEDPIIGNQQASKVFWERVSEKFNAGRPIGSIERTYTKLRKHWGRVQKEVSKWNGKWKNVVRMWPSGHTEADIVAKTHEEFYLDGKRSFAYYDVWKLLQKSPKFSEGAEPAGSGSAKRTRLTPSGNYCSSDGGPSIDLNTPEDEGFVSSPSTQSRPMGTKAAKRKAYGGASSQSTMPVPPPNPSLDRMSDSMTQMSISLQVGHLKELLAQDTSTMSAFELECHMEMIEYLRSNMRKRT